MNNIKQNLNPLNKMTEQNIKSLMKKTKAQLIDVISRKDATELSLNEKITKLEEENLNLQEEVNQLKCDKIDLENIISSNDNKVAKINSDITDKDNTIHNLTMYNKELVLNNNSKNLQLALLCAVFIITEIVTIFVMF